MVIIGVFAITFRLIRGYAYDRKYCEPPVRYSVGSIDSKFNLDRSIVVAVAKRAGNNWDNATGRDQFIYDESGPTKISFIFDDRQLTLDKNKKKLGAFGLVYENEDQLVDVLKRFNKEPSQAKSEFTKKILNIMEQSKNSTLGINHYDKNGKFAISIYVYDGEKQLEATLMHELGHSKTRLHANRESSIMYPENLYPVNTTPSKEDVYMVKNCK